MNKKQRYKDLLIATEKQFARGESSLWKNKDFEDLSKAIWTKSHILISAATLKRMFGKVQTSEDYLPQESTLDALELYSNPLKKNEDLKESSSNSIVTSSSLVNMKSIAKNKRFKKYVIIAISTLALMVFVTFYFYKKTTPLNLLLVKKEGDYPATFYFKTNPNSDSIFFDKGDNSLPIFLPPNKTAFSAYYSYPGVYYSKLVTKDNQFSNTQTCAVFTNEWYASAFYFNKEYNPSIQIDETKKDSCLQVSQTYLKSINLDTTQLINLQLQNIKSTGVSGDNFKSEFIIKNPKNKQPSLCRNSFLELLGSNGRIKFNFVYPGCSYWLKAILSEKKLGPNDYDISGFTVDLSQWKTIEINNTNKHITVLLDTKRIFEATYTETIGELLGVNVMFNGTGMIKRIKVRTANYDKTIFEY